MLKRKWVIMSLCLIILVSMCKECISEEEFTISSKEIIERLTRLEEGQKSLDKRIDDLRSELKGDIGELGGRIDDLRSIMLTGFGILFAGMFVLIGFVIWDRRTALSPVVRKARELEEEKELTFRVLREYAKKEPKMEEVLKSLRLL
ncbi:MAG: hypothetical protein QME40_06480 [bacterium]|nr:hypothetical protein [bacterium]